MKTTRYERFIARRRAGCKRHDSVRVVCIDYPPGTPYLEQAPYVWGYRYGRRVMADGSRPVKRRHVRVGRRWLDQALKDAEALDLVAARLDAEHRRSGWCPLRVYETVLHAIGRQDTGANAPLQTFLGTRQEETP